MLWSRVSFFRRLIALTTQVLPRRSVADRDVEMLAMVEKIALLEVSVGRLAGVGVCLGSITPPFRTKTPTRKKLCGSH